MSQDVLIVGGGVIGVSIAYYLSSEGLRVSLLDKRGVCSTDASSYGNAGLIVPSHVIPLAAPGVISQSLRWMLMKKNSPFYIKPRLDFELLKWLWQFRSACNDTQMHKAISIIRSLNIASYSLLNELQSTENIECSFDQRGWLHLYTDEKSFHKAAKEAELLNKNGITLKILGKNEVLQYEPHILPSITGGIYFAEDAHLNPHQFVTELAKLAQKRGVNFLTNTEVITFETKKNKVDKIITTKGQLKAEQVVLATGVWTSMLGKELGLNLPLQPAKGYSITIEYPEVIPNIPLYLGEEKVAVTPLGHRMRLAGVLELSGLDVSIKWKRIENILSALQNYIKVKNNFHIMEVWRGMRPVTPDGLPIIGRSNLFKNLLIACGHGMLGITQGLVTGKLLKEIILDKPPSIDVTPLSIERFL